MKKTVFWNRDQFDKFLKTVWHYFEEYPTVKLYSYCILPNHFHFVLSNQVSWRQLSELMKKIQGSYSVWYRVKYPIDHKEPVFEWRFKAKLIETDEYLSQCLAYVNYNPVKHGLVQNIEDYPYTSYHQIMHGKAWPEITWDYKQSIWQWREIELSEMEF